MRVEVEADRLGAEVEVFPEADEAAGEGGVGEEEGKGGGEEEDNGAKALVERNMHVEVTLVPGSGVESMKSTALTVGLVDRVDWAT